MHKNQTEGEKTAVSPKSKVNVAYYTKPDILYQLTF